MSVCASCLLETGHTPECYYIKHPICTCTGDRRCHLHDEKPPTPRIALVDGDATTPLSAEALVVALFAAVPDVHKGQVMTVALAVQAQLDRAQTITLQANRVVRPDMGANGITA